MMDSTTLSRKVEVTFSELLFAQEILCNISDALEKCHKDSNLTREIGIFARTLKKKDLHIFSSEASRLKIWIGDICSGVTSIEEARIYCSELIHEVDKTLAYFNRDALPQNTHECSGKCHCGGHCHCNHSTGSTETASGKTSNKEGGKLSSILK